MVASTTTELRAIPYLNSLGDLIVEVQSLVRGMVDDMVEV